MNQPRVTWGADGWAETDGWALAYCTNPETHEYQGPMDVWVSAGTSLPACAFIDAPLEKEEGKAIVRGADGWMLVDDHRGQTAYDKQTRQSVSINQLGELPPELTLLPPGSQFDVWDEATGAWVKDDAAELAYQRQQAEAQRSVLMAEANQHIAILADAVELGMATQEEQAAYTAWRQYRVQLSRQDIIQQPIEWPAKPPVTHL
ncbi:MAG: tail fiber assembly protein [Aeromonas caviae]|nr:tail fiber assembly protein [Aeromonas caviae]